MRLEGARILVVEDIWVQADELKSMIQEAGGSVLGPAPNIARAFGLAMHEALDGAVLDVRLEQDTCVVIARVLQKRKVPFIVVSGYRRSEVPHGMKGAPFIAKPIVASNLVGIARTAFRLNGLTGRPSRTAPQGDKPIVVCSADELRADVQESPTLVRRLRAEIFALVGSSNTAVLPDLLMSRLGSTWSQLQSAIQLAEIDGAVSVKAGMVKLTPKGLQQLLSRSSRSDQ
jgi:CheY-like chemotaxis protein